MKLKTLAAASLLLAATLCTGCATIFSGTKAMITVPEGTPAKAQVFMNGQLMGETPTKFRIPKKAFGATNKITIKADGYKPIDITIDKRVQAGYIVLDVVTGLVELVVDFATGAIYKPEPKTIKYYLEKQ